MAFLGNLTNLKRRAGLFGCMVALSGTLVSGTSADAAALFWGTVFVKTGNLGACLNLGKIAMTRLGLDDVKRTSLEVTGLAGDSYAVITCLSSQKGVHAVVMVSSETGAGDGIRDGLQSEISRFALQYRD